VGSLKPIENTQLPTRTPAKPPAAYLYLYLSVPPHRVPTAFTPACLSASLPSLPTLPRHPSRFQLLSRFETLHIHSFPAHPAIQPSTAVLLPRRRLCSPLQLNAGFLGTLEASNPGQNGRPVVQPPTTIPDSPQSSLVPNCSSQNSSA
jgi:hypothetical protein